MTPPTPSKQETGEGRCHACDRVECPHLPFLRMNCDEYDEATAADDGATAQAARDNCDANAINWRDVALAYRASHDLLAERLKATESRLPTMTGPLCEALREACDLAARWMPSAEIGLEACSDANRIAELRALADNEDAGPTDAEVDEDALTAAHLAVEDVLIDFRDRRISVFNRGNGFVVREMDGRESSVMRMGTRDGLRIGIKAYLRATTHKERTAEGGES